MSLRELEYAALRHTVATRGTVRIALLPGTLLGWSTLALLLMVSEMAPLAVLFPFALLVGGFEAIHTLHVGVERIGRYIQVFCEAGPDAPRWESTAMAVGPALPGGGVDPLFTWVFVGAAALNLAPAAGQGLTWDLVAVAVLHLAFVTRCVRARSAAARQRAVELERFQAMRTQAPVS